MRNTLSRGFLIILKELVFACPAGCQTYCKHELIE